MAQLLGKSNGSLLRGKSLAERFWLQVQKKSAVGCWEWTGMFSGNGYGAITDKRSGRGQLGAHRVSWEIHNGPIPAGLWVLHHCDTPRCVNPSHLFLGDVRANVADRDRKGRGISPERARHTANRRRGELAPGAKLSAAAVSQIRLDYPAVRSYRRLASLYGVTPAQVRNVVKRRAWKHVA